MVETTQQFENHPSEEYCEFMALLGVCLEPAMCELRHIQQSTAQLSEQAKEFNPFAPGAKVPTKEFDPAAPKSQQSGILDILSSMGMDVQIDPDMGTVFVKEFEDDPCCKGFINNCKGVACQSLGMCSSVIAALHDA